MRHPLPDHLRNMEVWRESFARAWTRLSPSILDLTGGEPLTRDIPGLLRLLPKDIRVGITTNTQHQDRMKELATGWTNETIISWTLSYHPGQYPTDSKRAEFWGWVSVLKSRGFHVCVNFVGHPDQLVMVPTVQRLCRSFQANFHFDPYAVPPGRKAPEYTPGQLDLINSLTPTNRTTETPGRKAVCSAGKTHLMVFPSGVAYHCMQPFHKQSPAMGNILDEGFQLRENEVTCLEPHWCAGCDRDKVNRTFLE